MKVHILGRLFRTLVKASAASILIAQMGCGRVDSFISTNAPLGVTFEKVTVASSTLLNISEGNQSTVLFIFNRKLPQDVTLNWSIANHSGAFTDHTGTVNLLKDDESFSITLEAVNDNLYFPIRNFNFSISLPTTIFQSNEIAINVRLTDNDPIPQLNFQLANQSVSEGVGSASIGITSSQAAGVDVALTIAYSGTATDSTDYTSVQNFTLLAGQTSGTISLPIIDDSTQETNETVILSLDSTSLGTIGATNIHTLEVLDNEIGAFSIEGIIGNLDTIKDNALSTTVNPEVTWTAAALATSYDVEIFDQAGSTSVCALQNTTSLNFAFAACNLTLGASYQARVYAKAGVSTREADNSPFNFFVNRSPVGVSETLTMAYNGGALSFNPAANDSDPDGHSILVTSVTAASKGTVTLVSGTSVQFNPAGNFDNVGLDSFNYTVSDIYGGSTTVTITVRLMSPYTWTGAIDNNWNTSGNWCGNVTSPGLSGTCAGGPAPSASGTSTHRAFFNSTMCSGASCNVTINSNAQANSMHLQSDYTGTITQSGAFTLTLGANGYRQDAGAFVGGTGAISSYGNFLVNAGSFTSTTAQLGIYYSGMTVLPAASFVHNGGHVAYIGQYNGGDETFDTNGVTFFDFSILSSRYSTLLFPSTNSITVLGDLTLRNENSQAISYGGTIEAKGDIFVLESGAEGHFGGNGGDTLIRISGNTNQTITGYSTMSLIPAVEIASTGGIVTFTGTLEVSYGFDYVQGNVDLSGLTLEIIGLYNGEDVIINNGPLEFNNLRVESSRYSSIIFADPVVVKGNLSIADYNNANTVGSFYAHQNVDFGSNISYPSLDIHLVGTGVQTFARNAYIHNNLNKVTINKPSGSVFLGSDVTLLGGATGDFTITSGLLDLSGFSLTVPDTLRIESGSTMNVNGGSYTAGTIINNGTINP